MLLRDLRGLRVLTVFALALFVRVSSHLATLAVRKKGATAALAWVTRSGYSYNI